MMIAKLTKNPVANHRLTVKALEPQEHYCLVRLDQPRRETDSGLLLPKALSGPNGMVSRDDGKKMPQFQYHHTAVIVKLGPDAENCSVGERILFTVNALSVTVADGEEEAPLALFDTRDIVCKVSK
jgi:hypothetical protein